MTPKERILAWIEEDREVPVKFLSAFVAIPPPNPPGDTRPAADLLLAQLRAKGAPVEIRSAKEPLPNIVAHDNQAQLSPVWTHSRELMLWPQRLACPPDLKSSYTELSS